jgi:rRNA-processing protein FCF1
MAALPPELPPGPVVDTNILFDFLLWRFCMDAGTRLPTCLDDTFAAETSRRALQWYFEGANPIHTSPHVIAEIHGLIKARAGWREPRVSEFWQYAQAELVRLRLSEHLVELVNMNREDLGKFGPTDDSILELATHTGRVVITEDGALRGRLTEGEIRVLSRWEIFAHWQEWRT